MPVVFFKKVELLGASVQILTRSIRGVTGVVLVGVGPCVVQVAVQDRISFLLAIGADRCLHLASIRPYVCECVVDMG